MGSWLVLVSAISVAASCSIQAKIPTHKPAGGQFSINYSGVELFWRIYDVLRQDREPTPTLWDELFSSPGYAALERKVHKRKVLTESFRIA